ncbi:MAG: hypothetical protein J0L92_39835 [Deltaproteobacteria bacterium]|nr:hypothetical protein [Deltaproteobacteria bacterium]
MASMNGVFPAVLGLTVAGLAVLGAGCGDPPPSSRPDAFVAPLPDTGPSTGTDAFVDPTVDSGMTIRPDTGMTTRMCRSPMGECDLLAQDCPMGETCVYALPDAMATAPQTVCAPIVGAGSEEGSACCALNSCDTGLVCVGATETMPGSGMCSTMGSCRRYCCGSSSDCAVGELCTSFGSSFSGGICDTSDDCSLVAQTGCPAMQGCYPDMGGTVQCIAPTAAMAAEGATCMFTNDCVPGTGCFTVTPGGGGTPRSVCLRFCDVGDGAADCTATGTTCQAAGDLPTGTGVCPPAA